MVLNPDMPDRKGAASRLSPWLVVGMAMILALAVVVLAVRNTQRERRHMSQNLMDRAEALIWALEAGTRIWMGKSGGGQHLQALLAETAMQPGIAYMAVVDGRGVIIAHSNRDRIGQPLHAAEDGGIPATTQERQWRTIETPSGKVFEVYKVFSPSLPLLHDAGHAPGSSCTDGGGSSPPTSSGYGESGAERHDIFVGLAVAPFEEALTEDLRNAAMFALLVVTLGFGGFISLFWAQNYRLSRRLLRDTRAFAAEVVTQLPVGLLVTDGDGAITMANASVAAMLRQKQERLEGSPLGGRWGVDWRGACDDLAAGKPVMERECELVAEDGRVVPASLSASRIVNEDGEFLGHLFILRNLEEVKRLQDQLRRNERLSALGNLAAGVAHEIRNPLSSIKGFATYLAGRLQDDGKGRDAARLVVQEVDRLNRVVSELLEFARPGVPDLREVHVDTVIERSVRLAATDAAARGVDLRCVPGSALPPAFLDAERFTQALLNLLLNAVEATPPGGSVEVRAAVRSEKGPEKGPEKGAERGPGGKPDAGPRAWLDVQVADTGRGMSPDVLKEIFNPYFTTKPSGTGLGLAIVHGVVEAHGGSIKVESQPERGTTVTISLPLRRPA
uniref:histidine kinase n=1 Tax=Nitratidesulfovibrio vulgaris (strain DSM 19637 / Miyazaki F) TaxID=883 RepID=B8DL77_NITV9